MTSDKARATADNPEWTEEDFARARPASELLGRKAADALVRKGGRPALAPEQRKQQVTIRLSPDVLAAVRKTGPGWQGRVDRTLRDVFLGRDRAPLGEIVRSAVAAAKQKGGVKAASRTLSASPKRGKPQKKRA